MDKKTLDAISKGFRPTHVVTMHQHEAGGSSVSVWLAVKDGVGQSATQYLAKEDGTYTFRSGRWSRDGVALARDGFQLVWAPVDPKDVAAAEDNESPSERPTRAENPLSEPQ